MKVCPNCNHTGAERTCPVDGFPMIAAAAATDAYAEPSLIGTVLDGRYEITKVLGSGGMGWVFGARQVLTNQDVAVKVMRRNMAQDLQAIKRFYQEARISAQLKHPHTIRVFDFGAAETGHLYIAMECLDGAPLNRVIRKEGSLGVARSVRIARSICEALDEAHEKGLVHRDLKPPNIFLCQLPRMSDYVKVLDFGVAKLVEGTADQQSITKTGLVIGTPRYLPPEQAQAKPVDRRTDLYAVGIILHEMITGRAPFLAESDLEVLWKQVHEPPDRLPATARGEDVPAALADLVQQLLAKAPEDRPQRAADVADRLGNIEASLDQATTVMPGPPTWNGAEPSRASTGERRAPSVSSVEPLTRADVPRLPSRTRWMAVAGAMVLVAAGAVALAVAPTGGEAPRSAAETAPDGVRSADPAPAGASVDESPATRSSVTADQEVGSNVVGEVEQAAEPRADPTSARSGADPARSPQPVDQEGGSTGSDTRAAVHVKTAPGGDDEPEEHEAATGPPPATTVEKGGARSGDAGAGDAQSGATEATASPTRERKAATAAQAASSRKSSGGSKGTAGKDTSRTAKQGTAVKEARPKVEVPLIY